MKSFFTGKKKENEHMEEEKEMRNKVEEEDY
jgi:hypothetical protein